MAKKKGTDKLLREAYDEIVEYVLRICQGKYNFDYQMAKKTIYANGKHNFLLPFVGYIDENRCKAVKYASGLHIQCRDLCKEKEDYCEKHLKEAQKSRHKKPNVGDIRDRKKCPLLDYVDLKKRRTKAYISIVKQKKMDKDECLYEAKRAGIVIPEIHWKVRINRRGRPRKKRIIAVSDTDSDSDDSLLERIHTVARKNEIKNKKFISLRDTDEGLVDEELGFIYSKKTHELIGFM